jgi:hypothetical protein
MEFATSSTYNNQMYFAEANWLAAIIIYTFYNVLLLQWLLHVM